MGFAFAAVFLWLARPTWGTMVASLLLVVPGLWLRGYASGYVKKNAELATTGPYAHTRNPLYLGSMLIAFGFAAAAWNLLILLVLAGLFAAIYIPTILGEEAYLREHFAGFEAYARAVPRLLPRLTPAPAATSAAGRQGGFRPRSPSCRHNALMGAGAICCAGLEGSCGSITWASPVLADRPGGVEPPETQFPGNPFAHSSTSVSPITAHPVPLRGCDLWDCFGPGADIGDREQAGAAGGDSNVAGSRPGLRISGERDADLYSGLAGVYGGDRHVFHLWSSRAISFEGLVQQQTRWAAVNMLFPVVDRFQSALDTKTGCSSGLFPLQDCRRAAEDLERSDDRFRRPGKQTCWWRSNLVKGTEKSQTTSIPACGDGLAVRRIFYAASQRLVVGQDCRISAGRRHAHRDGDHEGGGEGRDQDSRRGPSMTDPGGAYRGRGCVVKNRGAISGSGTPDDARHMPVQIRARLFWGTITFHSAERRASKLQK